MDAVLNYTPKAEEDFYGLLGCDENSNLEQINTEYKLRALKEHPDKNINDNESVEKFKKLQLAKEILTDPVKRADYDRWRNSGMAVSYEQWTQLKDVKTTLHWASKPKTNPMIESAMQDSPMNEASPKQSFNYPGNSEGYIVGNIVWHRQQGNELLKKFRNYEI